MLVVASRASVPSSVLAHALDPLEALDGLRMVARHIGEIGAGHRFRWTAAAGARRTGACHGSEQDSGEYLQHSLLVVCSMARWVWQHRSSALRVKSCHNVSVQVDDSERGAEHGRTERSPVVMR